MLSQSYLTDDSSVHQVRQICGFGFTARLGGFTTPVDLTIHAFSHIFWFHTHTRHKNNKIALSGDLLVAITSNPTSFAKILTISVFSSTGPGRRWLQNPHLLAEGRQARRKLHQARRPSVGLHPGNRREGQRRKVRLSGQPHQLQRVLLQAPPLTSLISPQESEFIHKSCRKNLFLIEIKSQFEFPLIFIHFLEKENRNVRKSNET